MFKVNGVDIAVESYVPASVNFTPDCEPHKSDKVTTKHDITPFVITPVNANARRALIMAASGITTIEYGDQLVVFEGCSINNVYGEITLNFESATVH